MVIFLISCFKRIDLQPGHFGRLARPASRSLLPDDVGAVGLLEHQHHVRGFALHSQPDLTVVF